MTAADVREIAEAYVEEHDLLAWCGVAVSDVGRGTAEFTVEATDRLANPDPVEPGYVHGGVLSMLAEVAGGVALLTLLEDPEGAEVVTTDLDMTFLRPATEDVHAVAETVRCGGTVGVVEISVQCGCPGSGRQRVATGTITYRLFRDGGE